MIDALYGMIDIRYPKMVVAKLASKRFVLELANEKTDLIPSITND